jgi:hypothetical protein
LAQVLLGGWEGSWGILMRLPGKYPQLVSFVIEASRNLKVFVETVKMQKYLRTINAYTESNDLIFM